MLQSRERLVAIAVWTRGRVLPCLLEPSGPPVVRALLPGDQAVRRRAGHRCADPLQAQEDHRLVTRERRIGLRGLRSLSDGRRYAASPSSSALMSMLVNRIEGRFSHDFRVASHCSITRLVAAGDRTPSSWSAPSSSTSKGPRKLAAVTADWSAGSLITLSIVGRGATMVGRPAAGSLVFPAAGQRGGLRT